MYLAILLETAPSADLYKADKKPLSLVLTFRHRVMS